jgi:hypothetical protein
MQITKSLDWLQVSKACPRQKVNDKDRLG